MSGVVRIRRVVLEEMVKEARRAGGVECCGLLAGRGGVITTIYPAPNALASAAAYEIAPAELFRIFREMRAVGLEHMGIYHSHPAGENTPSARDVEQAYYPEAAYFIVSPADNVERAIRAFSIRAGQVAELTIELVN